MATESHRQASDGSDGAGSSTGGTWSAWEAIQSGTPRRRFPALSQPRSALLVSMVVVGLLALVYLHTAGDVAVANSRLQAERTEQLHLQRQDQQLHLQLGEAQSPAYIARAARAMGLLPAPGTQP